jgi:hypothetical protein
MTTPTGVYPFATQDGKAIPLDIIKGTATIILPFTAGGIVASTIPPGSIVGVFMTDKACLVQFGTSLAIPLVENDLIYDSVFVPERGIVTVALTPGPIRLVGMSGPGTLVIQLIEKWAALALPTQFVRK